MHVCIPPTVAALLLATTLSTHGERAVATKASSPIITTEPYSLPGWWMAEKHVLSPFGLTSEVGPLRIWGCGW